MDEEADEEAEEEEEEEEDLSSVGSEGEGSGEERRGMGGSRSMEVGGEEKGV